MRVPGDSDVLIRPSLGTSSQNLPVEGIEPPSFRGTVHSVLLIDIWLLAHRSVDNSR
jgi:hypothetical protein